MDDGKRWVCCSMHDPSGRRGVWFRVVAGGVEVCAGREGDDWYCKLTVGEVFSERNLRALLDCLEVGDHVLTESVRNEAWVNATAAEAYHAADGDEVLDALGLPNPHDLDGYRVRYAERDWCQE